MVIREAQTIRLRRRSILRSNSNVGGQTLLASWYSQFELFGASLVVIRANATRRDAYG